MAKQEEKKAAKPAVKDEKTAKAAPAQKDAAEEKEKAAARNYHVAKRPDGKWQVKFAGGEKAIKLFGTQAEAIAYAKKLAVNQEGSISIHKKDGKLRKQKYWYLLQRSRKKRGVPHGTPLLFYIFSCGKGVNVSSLRKVSARRTQT